LLLLTCFSTFRLRCGFWKALCRECQKQLDEIAEVDGYKFGRFFLTIFIPMIRSGIGVTAFFLFMLAGLNC